MQLRFRLLLCLPLFFLTASCEVLGVGAACEGAAGLREPERQLLACGGWLVYVEAQAGRIVYRDVRTFPAENGGEATGAARCGSCRIEVAAQDHEAVELARTIVHEAAHLEDDCRNGEAPAVLAEAAFLRDLIDRRCILLP